MTATDTSGQVFTFDDIDKYTRCRYRGIDGYVVDKGDHLCPQAGRHIHIELEKQVTTGYSEPIIHEETVNRHLKRGTVLWIDWNDKLTQYSDAE